jgi:hypothetical protein
VGYFCCLNLLLTAHGENDASQLGWNSKGCTPRK